MAVSSRKFNIIYNYFSSYYVGLTHPRKTPMAGIGDCLANLNERSGEPAGDGAMVVEAALARLPVENRAGEPVMASEEPLAPLGLMGECAAG